jgi:hypothetical protein
LALDSTRGQTYNLVRLLDAVEAGKLGLPEFQRDFVWPTGAIQQLLATVLSGWPMGSLLLLPSDNQLKLATRPLADAPPLEEPINFLVLDGQQRLTALYRAFYNKGDTVFAVKLEVLDEDADIDALDEAMVAISRTRWERQYSTPPAQLAAGYLPIYALREAADFFEWRDSATVGLVQDEVVRLSNHFRSRLSGLHQYELPAVVIASDVAGPAIARIFERVNRTGKTLSTFDLVVATSYSADFNLRDQWVETSLYAPKLRKYFEDDGLLVLTTLALFQSLNIRQRAILDLPGSVVRAKWHETAVAVHDAVSLLSNAYGAWKLDWLPYKSMLPVVGALIMSDPKWKNRELLDQWFWTTAFSGRYDVASNTRAVADYRALLEGTYKGPPSIELVREDVLAVNRRQNGALHRAFICMYASSKPIDPFSGVALHPDEILDPSNTPAAPRFVYSASPTDSNAPTLNMALTITSTIHWPELDDEHYGDGLLTTQYLPPDSPHLAPVAMAEKRLELVLRRLAKVTKTKFKLIERE